MITIIDATFDGSVFRPSQPVVLAPNTSVRLIVATTEGPPAAPLSFLDVAQSLRLEGPPDWSANLDKYLYGLEPDREG